jgi:hypothetical protein
MEKPKTLRELRDFLNSLEDKFLDNDFSLQMENEVHNLHYMDKAREPHYYDKENPEEGCMTMDEWKESELEFNPKDLRKGFDIGHPLFFEDIEYDFKIQMGRGMLFSQAMEALLQGKIITRDSPSWEGVTLHSDDKEICVMEDDEDVTRFSTYRLNKDDVFANDWMVVKE